jgi:hypothetical protein
VQAAFYNVGGVFQAATIGSHRDYKRLDEVVSEADSGPIWLLRNREGTVEFVEVVLP